MKQGKHDKDLSAEQAPANRQSGDYEPPATPIFPSLETLTTGLQSIFSGHSPCRVPITVLSRGPNIYASTFTSEVVTCRFADGIVSKLFCKYGPGYFADRSILRGVPYESYIYRNLLVQLPLTKPKCYGAYEDPATGITSLALEYLDGYLPVNKSSSQDALKLAAQWIGRFHADSVQFLAGGSTLNLNIYNAEYFGEWKRQMADIPSHLKQQFRWLAGMGERCDAFLEPLYKAPQTVIHGEFYPSNALIRAGEICVVDWESVGIGAGEIDLAALTQGPWPEEILQECEAAYRMARWGKSPPLMFDHTFCATKLYFYYRLLFHWLRFYPDRAGQEVWLFNHMQSVGEKLGLI